MIAPRIWQIAFIAYLFVWFGAIVPGHQRGVVLLPGACPAEVSQSSPCCAGKHSDSKSPIPSSKCAICYYTLTMSPGGAFVIFIPRLGLLTVLPPAATESIQKLESRPLYFGRAPPALT